MKKLKFNTKTKFDFNVKMNMVGKSVSEKLDCIKKIEAIVNQKNDTVTTFDSLPYSRGGKYKRHTSTLTDIITFDFDKESNSVTEHHTSRSANCPVFSVEVYSDKWLAAQHERLILMVVEAERELKAFEYGIASDFVKELKSEAERKETERFETIAKKQAEKAERIANGENIVESVEEFINAFVKNENWLKIRAEISQMSGEEKNRKQFVEFRNELTRQNITIEGNDRIFWDCFRSTK